MYKRLTKVCRSIAPFKYKIESGIEKTINIHLIHFLAAFTSHDTMCSELNIETRVII